MDGIYRVVNLLKAEASINVFVAANGESYSEYAKSENVPMCEQQSRHRMALILYSDKKLRFW